jgi:hypothetical protein
LPREVLDIKVKLPPHSKAVDYLATRSALVGMAVLVFFFGFWQFTATNNGLRNSATIGVPVIPTPSLLLTSTQKSFDHCPMVQYEVQQNDTLESLTHRFLVSEMAIREINNLPAEVDTLPGLLLMPVCELTPTGTTNPPTSTTNTPALEFMTYTPG